MSCGCGTCDGCGTIGTAIVGPDAWWNPFSTDYILVKPAHDWAQHTKETAVAKVDAKVEELKRRTGLDPLTATVAITGAPTWGYWLPQTAVGIAVSAAVGAVALFAYRRKKKQKRS